MLFKKNLRHFLPAFSAGVALVVAFILATGTSAAALPDTIESAAESDYPPFSLVAPDGRVDGFSVELLRAAVRAMGREVTFRTGIWENVRGWLEDGDIDALPLVGRTPEREDIFDFTVPYMTLHGAIVVRGGTTGIRTMSDLRGKEVAVMSGDNAEEYLRREDRGITIHTTPTFEDALRDLSGGRYDAVFIQRLVALRLIQEARLDNLHVVERPVEDFRQDFCFAVQEGDREMLAFLNEGLSLVMADGTYRHLHAKWFASMELPTGRKIIVGGDRNFPPFEFIDENGNKTGFNVDLTRAIARRLHLDIEIRLDRWAGVRHSLERGDIDIIQGMFYSPERDMTFDFTPPHLISNYVCVSRKASGMAVSSLADLEGASIIVQEGDIMHDYLVENGFGDATTVAPSQEAALRSVTEGDYDCALTARLTALYWIDHNGWDTLQVGNHSLLSLDYCYAVPNGRRALLAQFSEGLKMLEKSGEYREIYEKWLGVYEAKPISLLDALRYSILVLVPLVILLLVVFLWSRTLQRQVRHRTADLRKSEEQYRFITENASDVIWTYSLREKRCTYISPSIERVFGYSPEEGMSITENNGEASAVIEQIVKKIRESDDGENTDPLHRVIELPQTKKDGTPLWTEVSFTLIRDAFGTPAGILGVTRDITERKNAEADRERLITAIDQAGDIIIITDADGVIEYVNPAFERITGYSRVEAVGQNPRLLKSGRQDEPFYRKLWDTIISGGTWEGTLVNKRKDGSLYTEEASISPVRDVSGTITNFVAVKRDITHELEIERHFRQTQKLESIGRLAGGVAHDLNNLLTPILGYAELLTSEFAPGSESRDSAEEIVRAGERARDLVGQLLAFGRKQVMEFTSFDLNDVLREFEVLLRRTIREDISIEYVPASSLPPVRGDVGQLEQVIMNLAINAQDAMPEGGIITIETAVVDLDEEYAANHEGAVPGTFVMLAISDTGAGMDADIREHIFEPFFTTKTKEQGTGLGLATVYGIVKQHRGNIWVYSEPGEGTTFKIYLPVSDARHNAEQKSPKSHADLEGSETILLVEDNEQVRNLATTILARLGYTVLVAGHGPAALEIAENFEGTIDLLLTDVIMPSMSGRELYDHIAAMSPRTRVIYMSGYTDNVIAHHGVIDEGVEFIQKPFSMDLLASKVREMLENG